MPRHFKFTENQVDIFENLYNKGWGTVEISRKVDFVCSSGQVRYALNKRGIKLRSDYGHRPQRSIPLSPKTQAMLAGMLLGDGHITKYGKDARVNSNFMVQICSKNVDFLDWIGAFLKKDDIHFGINTRKKNGKNFAAVLHTLHTKEFTKLRNIWYPNGKKVVPDSLILFPETIMAWYLSDGCLLPQKSIVLYTNGFSLSDNELLQSKLYDIGIKSNIHTQKTVKSQYGYAPNKVYYYLYVTVDGTKNLFSFIDSCPVPSLAYKWPSQ